jgi:hypothetical protein
MICAGQWKGPCGALAPATHRAQAREAVLPTIPSTPRRWATAGGCRQRTLGHVRRGHAHGSAAVRAGARSGAHRHQRAGARTPAHGRGIARGRRAHRTLSKLSADSAAGIVPSSEFEEKDLRRAWFVPLCSGMRMHRSVPRTHASTARGGRMGLRPRGHCTRVLEGVLHACPLRARAMKGTPAVPQCAHTFHGTCTHTRKLTSDSHAPTRAARVRARRWKGPLRGARTQGLAKRTGRIRTYNGTARHGGADGVPPLLAAGSESTRRGLASTAIVGAGEWCGHARPPAPRIRYLER